MYNILTINPGSTSTKVAWFQLTGSLPNKKSLTCQQALKKQIIIASPNCKKTSSYCLKQIAYQNIAHAARQLKQYKKLADQLNFRRDLVLRFIADNKCDKIDCIVGRGGLLKPLPAAGSYAIDHHILDDLKHNRYGAHASNLGALIANALSKKYHCPALIADPVCVDEFIALARYSGLAGIKRRAQSHVLNIRATACLAAKDLDLAINKVNFIVAHLGGGISIVPLQKGRIIDSNNALDGGPFSPQRSGTLPITQLVELAFSGQYKTASALNHKLTREAGLLSYLGTDDGKEIVARISKGDAKAKEVLEAMAYQIAKEIGAMATVLHGKAEAIILTGGFSRVSLLVNWIKARSKWIAPIVVYPGEREQEALAEAGARYLLGEEKLLEY